MVHNVFTTSSLVALSFVLNAGRADAQYYGRVYNNYFSNYMTGGYNPGFVPGLYINNPYTGQSFSYNYTSRLYLGADYVNPATGIRNTFYYNNVVSGPFIPGIPLVSPYYPYTNPLASAYGTGLYGGYLSGGVGTYGTPANNPALNPVVQEQVRLLRAAGNQGGNNDIEARKMIADQWAYEQRAKTVAAPVAAANAAFRDATEAQILSGQTIIELAAAIRSLDGKGAKANAPLLPADLLSHVSYTPGVSADVMDLAAAGKLTFPETLSGQEWVTLRSDIQKAATPVLESAAAGKRVPSATADKLASEVATARKEVAPLLRQVSFPEATELTKFLNRLDSLAKLGTDANLNGVYVPTWTTVGASLNDYVKHLGKYNLTIAPRADGDDEAYTALYRAMLDYYSAISAKK